jgi:hypothetical protein
MATKLDPNFKELILTLCVLMPPLILFGMPHPDKSDIAVTYFSTAFVYLVARLTVRRKTGSWKW